MRSSISSNALPAPTFNRIVKFWIVIVLIFVFWQPFELGFYMDDWAVQAEAVRHGAAFTGQRLRYNIGVDPSRPGLAGIRFVLSSMLGDRPLLWQLAMLLSNFLVAISIAGLTQTICGWKKDRTNGVGLAIGLSWLILPWSTSSQFWTVLLPVELSLALFAFVATVVIVERPSRTVVVSIAGGLSYLWICISYEVFYGQFIPVVIIGLGLAILGRIRLRAMLWILLSFGTAQALAIGWYFASGKLTAAQKPISAGWEVLTIRNLAEIAPGVMQSMGGLRWPFLLSLLGLMICLVWIMWSSRRKWAMPRRIFGSMLIALGCVLGAVLSILAFSLGGRPLAGLTVENRVYVLVSFWLVVLAALTAAVALRYAKPGQRKLFAMTGLACGMILCLGHTVRALDWADAWTQQQNILRDAPVEQLQSVEPDAVVVLINPLDVNGAPIFAAPWDINHALPLTYPTVRSGLVTVYSPWGGPMVWDGNRLAYVNESPLVTTRDLYIWIPAHHLFHRARRPFQIGQDLQVSNLP